MIDNLDLESDGIKMKPSDPFLDSYPHPWPDGEGGGEKRGEMARGSGFGSSIKAFWPVFFSLFGIG